uniref:Lipocalin-like domain-containing protein n=1 Tax=Rhodopseudomonas palustris (strain BisA53) TaxID=316055 RepID=Q07J92_RHOP5
MRSTIIVFLLAVLVTSPSLAQNEPVVLGALPGEWYQIASNAGKCQDCRIRIERVGQDFTVTSNNGWSAIVRQSFQGKPFVAGKGGWRQNFGGVYAGRAFFLNLGMKGDELLMLMTVPSPDGNLQNIEAIFGRQAASGGT